jgi:DNA polymerase III subunit delta'
MGYLCSMRFENLIGHFKLSEQLQRDISDGRVPHAQLFVGTEGSGVLPLAIAYAHRLITFTSKNPDEKFIDPLAHPDIHFIFPVAANDKIKKHPVSSLFLEEWRAFIKAQPYGNLFDWYQEINIENKQGQIGVDEAQDIIKSLALKSYEGGYKIVIVWMAEKMNATASNKLLKLIEEPPAQTVFLLIAEDDGQILDTIRSRCQYVRVPHLTQTDMVKALVDQFELDKIVAQRIAVQAHGNFNKAADLVYSDSEEQLFDAWFVQWVRSAFSVKQKKSAVNDLMVWSLEVSKTGRETQKRFIQHCLHVFRQALLKNYGMNSLVFDPLTTDGFNFDKFAAFIHEGNIIPIREALEEAFIHVSRNGNPKLIWTDLSLDLTRLIHKKAS